MKGFLASSSNTEETMDLEYRTLHFSKTILLELRYKVLRYLTVN